MRSTDESRPLVRLSPNIAIAVKDRAAALDFYEKELNFFLKPHPPANDSDQCEGIPMQGRDITFWVDKCDSESSKGKVFFEFTTKSLEKTLARLEAKGCKITSSTSGDNFFGKMMSDPYGMNFHVYEYTQAPSSPISRIRFGLVYAKDIAQSQAFYKRYFGFKKSSMPFDDGSIYGTMGNVGLWIGKSEADTTTPAPLSARASCMFGVHSVQDLFDRLKGDGVAILQTEPALVCPDEYWFQFRDPSQNIIEVVGPK